MALDRPGKGPAVPHTEGERECGGVGGEGSPQIETFSCILAVVQVSRKYLLTARNMSLPSPTVSGEWPTCQRCLWKHGDLQCISWQPRSLYCRVWFLQKHLRLLVCPSSKEVKHGLSLLQHEIVGIMERRRRMWSADPPARTSKQRGSGGSIRQTRPDKLSPGLRLSHCLLCRHTTYPQSLPFKFASELRRVKGRGRRGRQWTRVQAHSLDRENLDDAGGKNCFDL